MRIVAGEFRGRVLKAPPAEITRPTTDRVREAMMSTLYSQLGGFEGLNVLDAFAGSGALGLECLSRGAERVTFYEKNQKALRVLQENLNLFPQAKRRISLRKADVLKNPPVFGGGYDLVLLDPPYATDPQVIADFLGTLVAKGMLSDEALVYYEHGKSLDVADHPAFAELGLVSAVTKTYGDIAFDIFRKDLS